MQQFEKDYAELITEILDSGEAKQTRNGGTKSVFGRQLKVDMREGNFPLLQGRKIFYKGVVGEFAAMIRKPKCLEDFERWGCNYWKKWAKPDGSINVDYGNAWFAGGQIARLKAALRGNPNDRRMIINAWRPEHLDDLDLPCCHYSYQFYVNDKNELSMVWIQRSVDMMIGLPSDIVLAAVWLMTLANEFDFGLGDITMQLGDCHVYDEHYDGALEYLYQVRRGEQCYLPPARANLLTRPFADFLRFEPSDLWVEEVHQPPVIKFLLKE